MASSGPCGADPRVGALLGLRGSIWTVCDSVVSEGTFHANGIVPVSERGDEQVEGVLHIARVHSEG